MSARGLAKLYGAGIKSPGMVWHVIDHATSTASNAPRLTPSGKARNRLRNALRIGALLLGAAWAVVAYG